jgi:UDP-glucuronate decarboxylase
MLENDGRVVSNFVTQALRNIPLTVYGDGSQTRSFCYVSDLVEGLMRLMNGDFIGPVNLGNPEEYTILELASAVQELVNPNAEIQFKPLPQDDPRLGAYRYCKRRIKTDSQRFPDSEQRRGIVSGH